jgi:hypothetical protein
MIRPEQAFKGTRVIYIPAHARGDRAHPDCQAGVVKELTPDRKSAWVIYDNRIMRMRTGDEAYTAQATCLADLELEAP